MFSRSLFNNLTSGEIFFASSSFSFYFSAQAEVNKIRKMLFNVLKFLIVSLKHLSFN